MKIPISLPFIGEEEEQEVIQVLRSNWIMQGSKVEKFEKILAEYIGVPYATLVSSGTAALHLSLLALGIGKGDEVIVPSLSFIASANCILYTQATPVFADVDQKTFNIDPSDIEKKITKKTKAVIAVHQIGLSADMDPIQKICINNNLLLIEDAACALGSLYKGKKVGTFGNTACFSFHPRKSITTGEGGLVATSDKKLFDKLKKIRSHGATTVDDEETYFDLGFNYRMTDIQAGIGIAQFKKFNYILKRRQLFAKKYNDAFKNIPSLICPFVPNGSVHTYQSYMIRIVNSKISRDALYEELKNKGISTKKGISLIHKQPLYEKIVGKTSLPVSEQVNIDSLLLPLYPQMIKKEQEYVIENILSLVA